MVALMQCCLQLRNCSAETTRLTDFASGFAHRHGLPEEERARLLVILDELFTNVLDHGYDDPGSEGRIEVRLTLEANRLTIEFVDDGRPFDPLTAAAPALELPTADRPVGGLGLHIVRSLVDAIDYRREASRNRLVLGRTLAAAALHHGMSAAR